MTTPRPVQLTHLRQLAITKQYLHDAKNPTFAEVVSSIGCLQLDPISAVAKNHRIVMWSRVGNYDMKALSDFIYGEKQMFEYWAHAASLVLSDDYPIHRHWMSLYPNPEGRVQAWINELGEKGVALKNTILTRLQNEGALPSRAFEGGEKGGVSSGWTGESTLNKMIDYLWCRGDILVAKREGNQRWWDIAERCLPQSAPRHVLSQEEVVTIAVQKAIQGLGIGTMQQIKIHFTRNNYPQLDVILKKLVANGIVIPVKVMDGITEMRGAYYLHSSDLATLEQLEAGGFAPKMVLLSPFDNLICDRKRTEELFKYFYRIEIYVPQAKRQYGYYVLSILQGDKFIGRIDPLMDRKTGVLHINSVHAEPNAPDDVNTVMGVRQQIEGLGTWLGAKEIRYSSVIPSQWAGIIGG
ncbi:MAG: crosslink repair DNA glycosylase YcaQ family protein [bacterium]|nr:crosslink repair DNA glycosylase YcaQ family protein [bacterium]